MITFRTVIENKFNSEVNKIYRQIDGGSHLESVAMDGKIQKPQSRQIDNHEFMEALAKKSSKTDVEMILR